MVKVWTSYHVLNPSYKLKYRGVGTRGARGAEAPLLKKIGGAEPPYNSGPVAMGLQLRRSCILLDNVPPLHHARISRARDVAYCHTSFLLAIFIVTAQCYLSGKDRHTYSDCEFCLWLSFVMWVEITIVNRNDKIATKLMYVHVEQCGMAHRHP